MITIRRRVNLDTLTCRDSLRGILFSSDAGGHEFIIDGCRGRKRVNLASNITARFIRADSTAVLLQGEIKESEAHLILSRDCYRIPGSFELNVTISDGAGAACVYSGIGKVVEGSAPVEYDNDNVVPSIDQLLAKITNCDNATAAANASADNANAAASHAVRYDKDDSTIRSADEKRTARANIDAIGIGDMAIVSDGGTVTMTSGIYGG